MGTERDARLNSMYKYGENYSTEGSTHGSVCASQVPVRIRCSQHFGKCWTTVTQAVHRVSAWDVSRLYNRKQAKSAENGIFIHFPVCGENK